MAYFNSKQADGSSANIFYEDYGNGRPVVLVHGWPLDHQMWEHQIMALVNNGYRVLAYDRKGFGKSDKPWVGYDYTSLAADLENLVNHLDLQNAVLVGFSMGGGEVVRYLAKGSPRVTKAVLLASVAPFMLKTEDNPDGAPIEVMHSMQKDIKEDRPKFLANFSKSFFGVSWFNNPVSAEQLQVNLNIAMQASLKATLDCVQSFFTTDMRPEIQRINIPVLVIHGDKDESVPINATSKQAAELLPNAQYKVYAGQPHGLYLTDMERLNTDLLEFIQ